MLDATYQTLSLTVPNFHHTIEIKIYLKKHFLLDFYQLLRNQYHGNYNMITCIQSKAALLLFRLVNVKK